MAQWNARTFCLQVDLLNISVFNLKIYRSACITYDGFKDLYKLYIDGVKVDSGAFSGDNAVAVVRSGGVIYLGQDQDSMGGGFNPRQTWSGEITQFNIYSFVFSSEWVQKFIFGNPIF